MGGETGITLTAASHVVGLSPRGRGNRPRTLNLPLLDRSIPAWAGKPSAGRAPTPRPGVYPRVGGETRIRARERDLCEGLSPRGRGNRSHRPRALHRTRSIPAWAGKPRRTDRCWPPARVYPRVGGETGARLDTNDELVGLSPRGRGNLLRAAHKPCETRSIPAWAGKPARASNRRRSSEVYPRVGGETLMTTSRTP